MKLDFKNLGTANQYLRIEGTNRSIQCESAKNGSTVLKLARTEWLTGLHSKVVISRRERASTEHLEAAQTHSLSSRLSHRSI